MERVYKSKQSLSSDLDFHRTQRRATVKLLSILVANFLSRFPYARDIINPNTNPVNSFSLFFLGRLLKHNIFPNSVFSFLLKKTKTLRIGEQKEMFFFFFNLGILQQQVCFDNRRGKIEKGVLLIDTCQYHEVTSLNQIGYKIKKKRTHHFHRLYLPHKDCPHTPLLFSSQTYPLQTFS